MSILVNKNRIMGLLAEIASLSESISGINGVRRSGGVISGELEISGDLSVTGDLLFTNSNFYIDKENRRFGINTSTPSGNLHIYSSSGEVGINFDGSGVNGLRFAFGNPELTYGDFSPSGFGDITHQESGSFVFDRYTNKEGRLYSPSGFLGQFNYPHQYSSMVNDRPEYYNFGADSTLVYQIGYGWTLLGGSGIGGTIAYLNDSTGYYPPINGWYSNLNLAPTGTVPLYYEEPYTYEPKIQIALNGEEAVTISQSDISIENEVRLNNLVVSDISERLGVGDSVKIASVLISDTCGLIFNGFVKNYTEVKLVNFNVGWTDASIFKKFGTSEVISVPEELDGVVFTASFNLPRIEVFVSNSFGRTVILGGTIKKLLK